MTRPLDLFAHCRAAARPPLCALLLCLVAPATASEPRGSAEPLELIVANRSSHEVTFVDVTLGAIVERVSTGEGPHLLSNVSDDKIVATGYGVFPAPHEAPVTKRPPFQEHLNARLTVIDTRDRRVLLDRHIEGCERPHASWIVGETVFVTCEDEQRIAALMLDGGDPVGFFDSRQAGSHVLAFDPPSRTLAVTNTQSGSLTLIDIDTGEPTVVTLDKGSEGLRAIVGRFWVGNSIAGSVSVVNATTGAVEATVSSVCGFPIALGESSAGLVWVACFGSAELVAFDHDSVREARRIALRDQPLNLLLAPSREFAYVAYPRRNAIGEIDLEAGEEVRRIAVGIEPDGLRWAGRRSR